MILQFVIILILKFADALVSAVPICANKKKQRIMHENENIKHSDSIPRNACVACET